MRKETTMKNKTIILGLAIVLIMAGTHDSFARQGRNGTNFKNRPSVEKVFEKADANKDQKLSLKEFKKHAKARKAQREKRRSEMKNGQKSFNKKKLKPAQKFKKIDTNKDGFITQDELKAHRKMRKEKRSERRKSRNAQ